MYRIILFVGGIAMLFGAAVMYTGIETGDIRASDGEDGDWANRILVTLFVGGLASLGWAIQETFFRESHNEAIERRRAKERERGVLRK